MGPSCAAAENGRPGGAGMNLGTSPGAELNALAVRPKQIIDPRRVLFSFTNIPAELSDVKVHLPLAKPLHLPPRRETDGGARMRTLSVRTRPMLPTPGTARKRRFGERLIPLDECHSPALGDSRGAV